MGTQFRGSEILSISLRTDTATPLDSVIKETRTDVRMYTRWKLNKGETCVVFFLFDFVFLIGIKLEMKRSCFNDGVQLIHINTRTDSISEMNNPRNSNT